MGEQHGDLLERRLSGMLGLLLSRFEAHHDVTEEVAGVLGKVTLPQGKCEDIRGAVFVAIVAIENAHFSIINKGDRYFLFIQLKKLHHCGESTFDIGGAKGAHRGLGGLLD